MQEKTVIITGASSGIGRALAFEFGRKGSRLILTARNLSRLEETSQSLQKENIEHRILAADVSKLEDNQKMIDFTMQAYGSIDVLINNAGISMRALFEEVELDVIKKVMDINFYGTLYATKLALPHIIKTQGSIVGVSSIAGYRGLPGRTGYSSSKFAMQGFLESLRTELLPKKVHVLVACPGFTQSNIRKVALTQDGSSQGESPRKEEKMMSSEEVAARIYRAVLNRKRDLVMTRQGKLAVWMNKFFPGWMDHQVYKVMAKESKAPVS